MKVFSFEGWDNKPVNDGSVRKRLKTVCERAGVRYLSPHKMRAYAATSLVKAGADITTLMTAGGWSDRQTALHYVKQVTDADNLRTLVAKMPE